MNVGLLLLINVNSESIVVAGGGVEAVSSWASRVSRETEKGFFFHGGTVVYLPRYNLDILTRRLDYESPRMRLTYTG